MKYFLIGFRHSDASPSVVNRELYKYLPHNKFATHHSGRGLKRRLGCYWGILTSKKILISGIFLSRSEVKLIKLLRKKMAYLMHGSYTMETGLHHPTEALVRKNADRIISVSDVHARMIADEFPEYAHKVALWYNGVDWTGIEKVAATFDPAERDEKKIILFGGGRHMKGNLAVCQAVMQLNHEKNLGLHVDVYGEMIDGDFSRQISQIDCVNYLPLVPKDRINYELAKANLFIANSSFDTFNLSIMDAIGLGCNVLFSRHVGAKDVIPGKTDMDVINDVNDLSEIKAKIEHVLAHPNNNRLNASIDRHSTSWQARANEIADIMDAL